MRNKEFDTIKLDRLMPDLGPLYTPDIFAL